VRQEYAVGELPTGTALEVGSKEKRMPGQPFHTTGEDSGEASGTDTPPGGGRTSAPAVPVLMYHSVTDTPQPATERLSVTPRQLQAHLAILRKLHFQPITFSTLAAARRGEANLPDRPIVLTFDDGYVDFKHEALPLLQQHDAVATVFVTTGWVSDERDRSNLPAPDRMLSWSDVREVSESGMEIGAHSHSHPQLDQLTTADLREELRKSKALLEDRTSRAVHALAYPYGYSSPRVRRAVQAAGYLQAAAVDNAVSSAASNPFALPRLTVRRSVGLATFGHVVESRRVAETYLIDRALTAGWTAVRRGRRALWYLGGGR
jgi:peptidoglycan/xylan/chitin deacetylase (PgdA/CDA1 family)